MKSNIETYLRLKPLLNDSNNKRNQSKMIKYEINDDNYKKNKIKIYSDNEMNKGFINNAKKSYEFKFNGIFESDTTQEEIFTSLGNKIIDNSLEGYNCTLLCYGQTGSGKTYTICGKSNPNNPNYNNITPNNSNNNILLSSESGLIPRLLVSFFNKINSDSSKDKNDIYSIYISYIEIYNENAYDLFDKSHFNTPLENWKKIIVYEDKYGNIVMKNISMIKVENSFQALDLLQTGNYIRHASSTSMNMASSRSHAIFSIIIEIKNNIKNMITISKINLVDLAGSERLKSGNKNDIINSETKYINLSLSFLEQVIVSLCEREKGKINHIPYRNSLMTTILKDSLGGNCKTILIANASSEMKYLEETLSTMRFALRCAKVKNEVSKNEHIDLTVLVNQLQTENIFLKKKLNEKNNSYINNNCLPLYDKDLTEFEKDECKILISDYLDEKEKEKEKSNNKKIKAKNVNQLLYIIDFLIEYINNKEKSYKEKMNELIKENDELIKMAKTEDEKYKKINDIINKNNLGKFFIEEFNIKSDRASSIKLDKNNLNEFISSFDSDNIHNIFNNESNISYYNQIYSKKDKIDNISNLSNNNSKKIYSNGKKLKKIKSFSKKEENFDNNIDKYNFNI